MSRHGNVIAKVLELLKENERDSLISCIITYDENGIFYETRQCSAQRLDTDEKPKQVPKPCFSVSIFFTCMVIYKRNCSLWFLQTRWNYNEREVLPWNWFYTSETHYKITSHSWIYEIIDHIFNGTYIQPYFIYNIRIWIYA